MTTKEIQKLIGAEQVNKNHNPVAENVKFLLSDWEHDVISISGSGMLYEFEVKVSRSDFFAEKKKAWKQTCYNTPINKSCPNYFYYVCPPDIIKESDLPIYAGLMYAKDGVLTVIKKARKIHSVRHDKIRILEKINRLYACRHFLGATLLTIKNRK